MAVMLIDEVLVARMASAPQRASSCWKTDRLTARSSTIASITSLAGARAARLSTAVSLAITACRVSAAILPRSTSLARLAPTPAMPPAAAPSLAS